MKKILVIHAIGSLLAISSFSQVDYCTELNKAIPATDKNRVPTNQIAISPTFTSS